MIGSCSLIFFTNCFYEVLDRIFHSILTPVAVCVGGVAIEIVCHGARLVKHQYNIQRIWIVLLNGSGDICLHGQCIRTVWILLRPFSDLHRAIRIRRNCCICCGCRNGKHAYDHGYGQQQAQHSVLIFHSVSPFTFLDGTGPPKIQIFTGGGYIRKNINVPS